MRFLLPLLCFFLIYVSLGGNFGDGACTTNGAQGVVSEEKNVSFTATPISRWNQIALLYSLGKYNNQTDYKGSVIFNTTKVVSVGNTTVTDTLAHAEYFNSSQNMIYVSTCDMGLLPVNTTLQTVIYENPNSNYTDDYNVSVEQWTFDSVPPPGYTDSCPFCPVKRYFRIQVPGDGYGYNVSFATSNYGPAFLKTFKSAQLSFGSCDSTPRFSSGDLKPVSEVNGLTFGYLTQNGTWWLSLDCVNETAVTPWDLTITVSQTCLLGCLERGYCSPNAPQPYCICNYFYTGPDCSKIFAGTWALVAVGAGCVLCLIGYVILLVVRKIRGKKEPEKRLSLQQANPLERALGYDDGDDGDASDEERQRLVKGSINRENSL